MPHARKNASGRDRALVMRTPFRHTVNASRTTSGATHTETDLTCANLGSRVADMCYDFEYFRVADLRAYVVTSIQPGGIAAPVYALHGVAFDITPAAFVVTPTSVEKLAQFRHMDMAPIQMRPSIRVSRKEITRDRPMPWYHTQPTGSPDASESSIGTLYTYLELGCSGTLAVAANQYAIIEGVVEFSEPSDPTLSRARRGEVTIPPTVRDDPNVVAQLAKLKKAVEAAGDEDWVTPPIGVGIARHV